MDGWSGWEHQGEESAGPGHEDKMTHTQTHIQEKEKKKVSPCQQEYKAWSSFLIIRDESLLLPNRI